MPALFDAPPVYELPLSKGGDLHVTLVYKPLVDGVATEDDWPDGASVSLTIDTEEPTVVEGVIEGSEATFDLDYEQADPIKRGVLWRAVLTHASGLDEVLVNGVTVRADGK